jgi:hypothetical protein
MENYRQQRPGLSALSRLLAVFLAFFALMVSQPMLALAAGTTPQSIDPPSLPVSVGAPSTMAVPANSTSGLPLTVTVSSEPANVCSIIGWRVTFAALGTCYINYDQAGDATYSAAPRLTVQVLVDTIETLIIGPMSHTMSISDPPYQATLTTSTGTPIKLHRRLDVRYGI